ncbi:FAD-dependent monooxygenase [Dyadobacter chenhuakuii]|uniref:FAD-dependent monooxygenase n=1 Tax=Dyadobacter chenhuakuii TaxID=2909339 RepID=A0ABY4XR92_9BACT|nr:FAD-dependent monooxygenase [Dyadobacter chenhuakuii]MCF2492745.1 FAD-dependent monooxygenase [Dyadobacter chenhuakuii]USJ32964.1 FAD-dependent monooxygenase [Dyadobacter chenhuakuii]
MHTKDIAIIGGGIAGLTLAICLKGSRFKCHIFEKNPEFSEIGVAISLFPNALRVLKQLGLLPEVVGIGSAITRIFMKTDDGRILAQTEPRYQLPALGMLRTDLYAILLKHAEATFYPNHTLESFESTGDGKVKLTFNNGDSRMFDALIGADGINSVVRQGIMNDGKPVFRGYNMWRGIAASNSEIHYASESYGKGKRVGIVPLPDGRYGWWATLNEKFMADDEPEGTKPKLQRLFGYWHHPISELIAKSDYIVKDSLSDRIPVRGWTRGNCTLIGDAAHPTTPNLGQGGCLAIEGAYLLGEIMRKYGITDTAFQLYESIQFPRAKSIVDDSLMLGKMGQWENSVAVFLRNMAMAVAPQSITLKVIDKYFLQDVTSLKI